MKYTVKPTILLLSFVFSPNIGGVESHLDDLCSYLIKKDYKVVVMTYQPLISKATAPIIAKKHNLTIFRIPHIKFNLFNRLEKFPVLQILYLTPSIFLFSFLYLLVNNKKIDVIQTHGFNMAFVGAILSVVFKKKFTVNTHVSFNFSKKTLYSVILKNVLNRASRILVLTNNARKELVRIGISKEKIIVYHQWIDEKMFKPLDKKISREKLSLPQNSFIVFFAGRFVPAKGVSLILKAARKISQNIQFVFVGSGPLAEHIRKAQENNPSIRFVGTVDKNALPYYYSAADLSIIPSVQATKTYSEGIPRVFIESLYCGTPVIVTKTGGMEELLNSDIGFFVQQRSSIIKSLVEKLSKRKENIWAMKTSCIDYAKEQFSLVTNALIIEKTLL